MSGGIYSTYEIRVRAVRAVIEEHLPVTVVAQACGTDRSTIHRWISRYEAAEGEEGLLRRPVPGRPRKLGGLDRKLLWEMVLDPASAYGYETDFWTTLRLRQVIESGFGVILSRPTILRRLHEAGLTHQKPEREYFELSEEEREQELHGL